MDRIVKHNEFLNDRLISQIIIQVPEVVAGIPIEDDLTLRAAALLLYRDCLQFGLEAEYCHSQNIATCTYTPDEKCLKRLSARELDNIKRLLSSR